MALTQTEEEVQASINHEIDKASDKGIKIDTAGNADWGWHDIIGTVSLNGKPASQPSLVDYNGSGIYQHQFTPGHEVAHVFHMPHDYALGTDVYIHTHWSHDVAPTNSTVTWEFYAMWAKRDGSFGSKIITSVSDLAGTTALVHHVDEIQFTDSTPSGALIDSDLLEVDGIFIVRTKLLVNDSGQLPFLHTVDLHYQSTGVSTKNKISPFYT